jgi:LPXTG-motif cell wall-anchored protein
VKKLIAILAALAAALLSLAFTAPAAQAYPEDSITVDVNRSTLRSGQMLVVRVSADTECLWTVEFNGTTKTDIGKRTVQRFRAPAVDEPTEFTLTVTCTYPVPSGGTAAVKMADVERTVEITVLPAKGQGAPPADTNGLADTGGPNAWLLGGGLLLLAGGAGAVVVSRRRAAAN